MEYVKKSEILKIIEQQKLETKNYDVKNLLLAVEKLVNDLEIIEICDEEEKPFKKVICRISKLPCCYCQPVCGSRES